MAVDELDAIVRDLLLVARHVASLPRGYGSYEANRASVLLRRVDVEALEATLHSVTFVSGYYAPLTYGERQIYDAGVRLEELMTVIEERREEITARLRAA